MPHKCHATGCDKPVSPRLLMCAAHWSLVSSELKSKVYEHYRPGQERDKRPTMAYLDAALEAVRYVKVQEDKAKKPDEIL